MSYSATGEYICNQTGKTVESFSNQPKFGETLNKISTQLDNLIFLVDNTLYKVTGENETTLINAKKAISEIKKQVTKANVNYGTNPLLNV